MKKQREATAKKVANMKAEAYSMLSTFQKVVRSFDIDGFGFYNCDKPFEAGEQYLYAKFVDEEEKALNLAGDEQEAALIEGWLAALPPVPK